MRNKKSFRSCGIGGQAVLEGVMMKNKDDYAVAVRKPDGEIEVDVEVYCGAMHGSRLRKTPFVRGVFKFLAYIVIRIKNIKN